MKPDASIYVHPGSSITVTTQIDRRSESPPPAHLMEADRRRYGDDIQTRIESMTNLNKTGIMKDLPSIRAVEGDEPVGHDSATARHSFPFSPSFRSGFEESPEWREVYSSVTTEPLETERYIAIDNSNYLKQHGLKPKASQLTFTTANDYSSITTDDALSKKVLCVNLPPSRSFLKASNDRLRKLIRSPSPAKEYQALESEDDDPESRPSTKLEMRMPKNHSYFRNYRRKAGFLGPKASAVRKAGWKHQRDSSIINLNQVEVKMEAEQYLPKLFSPSLDDVSKAFDRLAAGDQPHEEPTIPDFFAITSEDEGQSMRPAPLRKSSSRNEPLQRSDLIVFPAPPQPGPRTSSKQTGQTKGPSSAGVGVAELPARSIPLISHKWPGTESTNRLARAAVLPSRSDSAGLRQATSPDSLILYGPGPEVSQATIDLIQDEANTARPLSHLGRLSAPFSINPTPPQPLEAPSEPPMIPLPDLPEECDKMDAASRPSSNTSSPRRLYRPAVPPRSNHRKTASTSSGGSRTTVRANKPPMEPHRRQSNGSSRSPRKTASVRSRGSANSVRTCLPTTTESRFAEAVENGAPVAGFNRYNLGSSRDLRSPIDPGLGEDGDTFEDGAQGSPVKRVRNSEALRNRSDNIKDLKRRDLAAEKATRRRSRSNPTGIDNVIAEESSPLLANSDATNASLAAAQASVDLCQQTEKMGVKGEGSRPASRNSSHLSHHVSRRSQRSSQRSYRPNLTPSQIIVIASTDPDTQTFRASTPTHSLHAPEPPADLKSADNTLRAKYESNQSYVRSRQTPRFPHPPVRGSRSSLSGQQTPPHSDSSASSDGIYSPHRVRSWSHLDVNAPTRPPRRIQSHAHFRAGDKSEKALEATTPHPLPLSTPAMTHKHRILSRQDHKLTAQSDAQIAHLQQALNHFIQGVETMSATLQTICSNMDPQNDAQGRDVGVSNQIQDRSKANATQGPSISNFSSIDFAAAAPAPPISQSRSHSILSRYNPAVSGAINKYVVANTDPSPEIGLALDWDHRWDTRRNSMGESVVQAAVQESLLWDQVDVLNARS